MRISDWSSDVCSSDLELRIGQDFTLFRATTTGHLISSLLRTLGAVFRTALLTVLDALGIQNVAPDVVADAGQVANTAAVNQHHRSLLKVVAFTGDRSEEYTSETQSLTGTSSAVTSWPEHHTRQYDDSIPS